MLAQMGVAHALGLSPRMRGNQQQPITEQLPRVYPRACGEPGGRTRVYPRACGGTGLVLPYQEAVPGLSPRMRGNRSGHYPSHSRRGSIPAHAGEPTSPGTATSFKYGSIPRMRGNLALFERGRLVRGSIPAHAGEPLWCITV